MGQTQTRINRSDNKFSTIISRQNEKLRLMELETSEIHDVPPENRSCFSLWFDSKPSHRSSNVLWKNHLIEQMKTLNLEGWPKQILKLLKETNTGELDYIYQSDVIWFDKNYDTKKNEHDLNLQKFFQTGKHSYTDQSLSSFRNDSDFIQENGKERTITDGKNNKDQDALLKDLFEVSEILDEKVYRQSNIGTWIDKSFDIRISGDFKQRKSFFEKSFAISDEAINNGDAKDTQFSMRRNSGESAFSNGLNLTGKLNLNYENNTLINQLPLKNLLGLKPLKQNDDLYHSIVKFKALTTLLEKHIKQDVHILRQIINVFEAYFVKTYTPIIEKIKLKKISQEKFDAEAIRATLDLQQFIRTLYEGINLYYQLRTLKMGKLPNQETLFNRDNMLSFVTSLIFNEQIYNMIFSMYQQQDKEKEDKYQKSIKMCQRLRPQDLTVSDSFCLNEKTLAYLEEKGLLEKNQFVLTQNSLTSKILEEDMSLAKNTGEDLKSSTQQFDYPKQEENQNNNKAIKIHHNKTPYHRAISVMQNLKIARSPIHKLKTILKVMELISVEIEEFYEEVEVHKLKKLDGDDTLSICIYIVAKAGLENLTAHCKIIERFSPNNALNSMSGYYASTLVACIDCLCTMDLQQARKLSDNLQFSFTPRNKLATL